MKRASVDFKTVSIKGKPYVETKERLRYLADNFDYSINTDYQYFADRKMWVVKATLTLNLPNDTKLTFTGLAQELESDSYKDVNHTSALENAETSAVGRACAMAGIGIDISVASADEMRKSINRGGKPAEIMAVEVKPVSNTQRIQIADLLASDVFTQDERDKVLQKVNAGKYNNDTAIDLIDHLRATIVKREKSIA